MLAVPRFAVGIYLVLRGGGGRGPPPERTLTADRRPHQGSTAVIMKAALARHPGRGLALDLKETAGYGAAICGPRPHGRLALAARIYEVSRAIVIPPDGRFGRSLIGVGGDDQGSGVRLAELVAAFSLATDLGMGQPMAHVLRSWLIARRLAERRALDADARVGLYYVMVLAWAGCVADTTEVATWFGDDIAFRADSYRVDFAGLPLMGFALSHVGAGAPLLHRLRLATTLVLTGGRAIE